MNLKNVWPLAVALVLGLAAAFMVTRGMARARAQKGTADGTASMVVLKSAVQPGKELTADDLSVVKVAPTAVPEGAFTDVGPLTGRVVKSDMVRGQPVLESMLAPTGAASGASVLVPAGKRAISLQVDEFSGVAGMLTRGCRVDLISVIPGPDAGATLSKTVVQNVEVLAVGRELVQAKTPADGSAPPANTAAATSVTLVVTPEQAEAIQLIVNNGRPWLVLRGTSDKGEVESDGVSVVELRGEGMPGAGMFGPVPVTSESSDPPAETVTPRPVTQFYPVGPQQDRTRRKVTVIRGTSQSEVYFDAAGEIAAGSDTGTSADPFSNPVAPKAGSNEPLGPPAPETDGPKETKEAKDGKGQSI